MPSQNELVQKLYVKLYETLGSRDHNYMQFDIKVKSENQHKKYSTRYFNKGKYKDIRKYLAKLDLNNMKRNKTTSESWNTLMKLRVSLINVFP